MDHVYLHFCTADELSADFSAFTVLDLEERSYEEHNANGVDASPRELVSGGPEALRQLRLQAAVSRRITGSRRAAARRRARAGTLASAGQRAGVILYTRRRCRSCRARRRRPRRTMRCFRRPVGSRAVPSACPRVRSSPTRGLLRSRRTRTSRAALGWRFRGTRSRRSPIRPCCVSTRSPARRACLCRGRRPRAVVLLSALVAVPAEVGPSWPSRPGGSRLLPTRSGRRRRSRGLRSSRSKEKRHGLRRPLA